MPATVKIHKKTFLTIALGVTILVVVIFLASWIAVMGGFSKLERISVQRNIFRAQEVVADKLNNLVVKLSDWTIWDDTYVFIEDKNEAYIKSNLTSLVLDSLQIDMMMFFNVRGEFVYSNNRVPDIGKEQLLSPKFKELLGTLLAHPDEKSIVAGIVMIPEGPLMVASRPVVKSNGEGPIRGTVIFAAYLNEDAMHRFSQIVRAEMSVKMIADSELPSDFAVARKAFWEGDRTFLRELDARTVAGYSLLKDISGADILMLKVSMPREITQFGMRTLFYFFVALVAVGFVFGVLVYVPLKKEIDGKDRAEQALQASEKRFMDMLYASKDAILLIDGEKFVDCNEAAAQMLRYSTKQEFLMTHPSELSPLQQPDGVNSFEKVNEMMNVAFEQGFNRFEWIHKKADGEEFPVEVSLTPVVIHGKNILHCLWRDMTETKYLAAELNKFHENLEIQVKERTEELVRSFQKLQATDEELKRASKAKSEFLANMSHELRTPLNSIIGFSEVLYDERFGPLNEKQKKYTQNVMVSGQHLLALINDVLDLSKVEAGKMVLEPTAFSILDCAEEVLRMMESQVLLKKIKLLKEIPADMGKIVADHRKIKQVLCNLFSNAIKFTPAEGRIGIRVQKIESGIEVAVWDTGVGISQENLEKVFGAFERLGDVYTQETEGTGLGLTICRKMIELHGGKIWIESEGPGKGSTVKFTVPGRSL